MYLGPEVMMPLASALAAIVGVLLMFWRRTVGALRSVASLFTKAFPRLFSHRQLQSNPTI